MQLRDHVQGSDTGTWSHRVASPSHEVGPPSFAWTDTPSGAAPPPITPRVNATAETPVWLAGGSGIVSGLSSVIVHMSMLILLGFFLVPMQGRDGHELRLAVTAAESVELEPLRFSSPVEDLEMSDPLDSTMTQLELVSMSIEEPALVSVLDDVNGQTGSSFGLEEFASASIAGTSRSFDGGSMGGQYPHGPMSQGAKSEFFGVTAYGDTFVYVLDISTSMAKRSQYGRTRYQVAAEELVRSVGNLSDKQQFFVILFSYRTRFLFDANASRARMVPATLASKRHLRSWLNRIQLAPGTDPRLGVMTGLRMKPSAVFLLSDGEFNGQEVNLHDLPGNPPVEQIVANSQRQHTPIHTIALEDKRNRKRLRRLAQASGGTHRFVTSDANFDVLIADLTSKDPEDVFYAVQCIAKNRSTLGGRQLSRATPVLIRLLATRNAHLRVLAHRALLALSAGEDFGPAGKQPTQEEIQDAQQHWASYWINPA